MSDETTLLPCPWCGKRQAIRKEFGGWILNTTSHDRKCIMRKLLSFGMNGGLVFTTKAEAIAAWNTRATHDTLTAEQVRETVLKHGNVMGPRFYGDWQAIADTLNAEVGGTCELEISTDMTAVKCSECGYKLPKGADLATTRFCGGCGKRCVYHG